MQEVDCFSKLIFLLMVGSFVVVTHGENVYIDHYCSINWHEKQIKDYENYVFIWNGNYPFTSGTKCKLTLRPQTQPSRLCFQVRTLQVTTYNVYARIYKNTANTILRTYRQGSNTASICSSVSVAYLEFGTDSYVSSWEVVNTNIAISVWAELENTGTVTVVVQSAVGGFIFIAIVVGVGIALCKYRERRRQGVTIVRPATQTQTVTRVEHHVTAPHPQQPPHPGHQPLVHSPQGHFGPQQIHASPIQFGHIQHHPPPPSVQQQNVPHQAPFQRQNPIGFEEISNNVLPGPPVYEAAMDTKGPPPITYPSPVKYA